MKKLIPSFEEFINEGVKNLKIHNLNSFIGRKFKDYKEKGEKLFDDEISNLINQVMSTADTVWYIYLRDDNGGDGWMFFKSGTQYSYCTLMHPYENDPSDRYYPNNEIFKSIEELKADANSGRGVSLDELRFLLNNYKGFK